MIKAYQSGNRITSTSEEAFSFQQKSLLGEKHNNKIEYSPVEALYLISKNKMHLSSGKKEISFDALLKKIKRTDKKIETKFAVFSDLRKKGYIVKTALKFGAEFRVYEKGVKPGESHARWILYPVHETDTLTWQDFSAKNRVAHSTNKKLLIGIVDEEGDVTYYEIEW